MERQDGEKQRERKKKQGEEGKGYLSNLSKACLCLRNLSTLARQRSAKQAGLKPENPKQDQKFLLGPLNTPIPLYAQASKRLPLSKIFLKHWLNLLKQIFISQGCAKISLY